MNIEVPTLLLTLSQVAEACQVSRNKVDEWSRRSGFPVIRERGTVRVSLELLKAWLADESQRTNAPANPDPLSLVDIPAVPLVPPRRVAGLRR